MSRSSTESEPLNRKLGIVAQLHREVSAASSNNGRRVYMAAQSVVHDGFSFLLGLAEQLVRPGEAFLLWWYKCVMHDVTSRRPPYGIQRSIHCTTHFV